MYCFELTAQQEVRATIDNEIRVIPSDEIEYIEYAGRKAIFHLAEGPQLSTSTLRVSFSAQLAPILVLPKFVQTHHSFAVNLDFVRAVGSTDALMADDVRIPISRSRHADFLLRFSCWHDYNNPNIRTPYYLLENLPVGSCVFLVPEKAAPIMTFCSSEICAHMGYTREELIQLYGGDPFLSIHAKDRPKFLQNLVALQSGRKVRVGFRLQCKDGSFCKTMTIAQRVIENNKMYFYIVFLFEDSGVGTTEGESSLADFSALWG